MHSGTHIDAASGEFNAQVALLDPLSLDVDLRRLPKINEAADVDALARVLCEALPTEQRIAGFTLPECLAAMRDLGMYLGSLTRHGVVAFDAVADAAGPFELLGRRAHMIPRDTVYHYTCWNPTGERERLYTGHPMERGLIDAVRTCVPELARAIDIGRSLDEADPRSAGRAGDWASFVECVTVIDTAMRTVLGNVSHEFFALELRPYFEEVRLGGRTYMGPAAAHVPLFLIDLLLWASDGGSEEYLSFCDELVSHTLPGWRERYAEWRAKPSLATRFAAALDEPRTPDESLHVQAGTRALGEALRALVSFRGKHLVMARRGYHEDVRLYELGSGGGSTELLDGILTLTRRTRAGIGPAAAS
ncbi:MULTISPECIES: monodechloroaminopyrrolnitrin synthase PrnB family protein [unclassified Streptomyces]|uniref:monodechloroaminopyrrolnitrin synthase PrnB family protein n=1 Tax=unclassified Streptomyces TaxID=2593676 RepID=UPI002E2C6A7B|nr:monodechloroaminopyrrolnitrin synthase PrnB family protein [Streptomyces sp. NBC_00273]